MTQSAEQLAEGAADTSAGASAGAGESSYKAFAAYTEALDGGDTPLLGYVVFYSVFEGFVTPVQLQQWFDELGLDPKHFPGGLQPSSAFERVTGSAGIQKVYSLDDPTADARVGMGADQQATLMIRPVSRDSQNMVRYLVREVRDQQASTLDYDSKLGEVRFTFDRSPNSPKGAGHLTVTPDETAIAALPDEEQTVVRAMLDEIAVAYQHRCTHYSSDRLRTVVRDCIGDLNAVKVRPTGAVYFVHSRHTEALAALRALVARFGQGSSLVRIPIPDQDEMRDMVITAFTTQAQDELNQLAIEIAAAQRGRASTTVVQNLFRRFRDVAVATEEHSTLLATSLDGTKAALDLVQVQLGVLLTSSTDADA